MKLLEIITESTHGLYGTLKSSHFIETDAKGGHFIKHEYAGEKGKQMRELFPISEDEVRQIISRFENLELPAFVKHQPGFDGGYTEIIYGGYAGKSHFRWWSVPPIEWEPLDQAVSDVLEIIERIKSRHSNS